MSNVNIANYSCVDTQANFSLPNDNFENRGRCMIFKFSINTSNSNWYREEIIEFYFEIETFFFSFFSKS